MKASYVFAYICLMLTCSCATQNSVCLNLPAETSFNQSAGRGDFIRVKLHLENGEELPFIVDSGASQTILDKSLASRLGKRAGTRIDRSFYGTRNAELYNAPELFLGNANLLTGSYVLTEDLSGLSAKGILGMDCLRHYCIQFDFAARKMRFLDPNHPSDINLGNAFPLTILFDVVFARMDIFGLKQEYFRTDTGAINAFDVMLNSKLFQWELCEQKPIGNIGNWTSPAGKLEGIAELSKSEFCGATYTNLIFFEWGGPALWPVQNLVGLKFLARNLVTFNFPKRMMYLKQQSVGPLLDEISAKPANTAPEPTATASSDFFVRRHYTP